MIVFHKITLEGELKYSDINFPVFLKITSVNNLLRYDIESNGELIEEDERLLLLRMGINQYAESRVYETFIDFRDNEIEGSLDNYYNALSKELSFDIIKATLLEFELLIEDVQLRHAS